jgi:hypothetical protein
MAKVQLPALALRHQSRVLGFQTEGSGHAAIESGQGG